MAQNETAPAPKKAEKKGYLRLLREEKQYLLYMVGNLISRFGDSVDSIAYGWMVYALTGSRSWLALIFAFNALPTILLQPFAGVWVERMNKQQVMVLTDYGRGAIIALTAFLYIAGLLQPWYLLLMTFLTSCLESLRIPAGLAALPLLLKKENYDHAFALNGTLSRVSELVGLAAAGAIVGLWGTGGALLVDGATYLLCGTIMLLLRLKKEDKEPEKRQYWVLLREGFALVKNNRLVRSLCLLAVLVNAAFVPANTLQAAYTKENLHLGVEALTVGGLSLTLAMAVGSFLYPYLIKKLRKKQLVVISLVTFSLSYALMAVCGLLPGAILRYVVLGVATAMIGAGLAVVSTILSVSFMEQVPQTHLSRAGSIMNSLSTGMIPLCSFLVSAAVTKLPVDGLFGVMTFIMLGVAIVGGVSKGLRGLDGDQHAL